MKANDESVKILVVDDSLDMLELLERHLEKAGFQVLAATAVPQAIDILATRSVDIVVTDLKMPGISGLELVRHVRDNLKDTEILLITGYPSVDGAVEAMKIGAADYLPKPFTSSEFLAAIGRLLDKLQARRSLEIGRAAAESVPGMIGDSKGMQIAFNAIRAHATDSFPVLIEGECGTGRRSVARALHLCGHRASDLFAAVDPLVPADGWFTDSIGTVYLPEPGTLPRKTQEEMLRRLEGNSRPRIVTSTSVDLAGLSTRGVFDERLFNRLASVRITLPPLAERGDDLLHLTRHFAEREAREIGTPVPSFTDRALDALRAYSWPGNVKELWWTVRRLVATSRGGSIDGPDLPSHMRFSLHGTGAPNRPLAAIETAYIQEVLTSVGGNRTRAAEILGIDRKTLRQKVKRATQA